MTISTDVLEQLRAIVGDSNVLTQPEDLIPYAFGGTAALKHTAGCVVFPQHTGQVLVVTTALVGRLGPLEQSFHLGVEFADFAFELRIGHIP